MKPPFDASSGGVPAPSSQLAKALPGGGDLPSLPGGLPGLPSLPGMPDLPDLPDIPDLPDLPSCLPGSCDALWNAVDKGLSPLKDLADSAGKAAEGALKAAQDVKDKALKAAADAKDKAFAAAQEAKDKATEALQEAKDKALKVAEEAKAKANKAVEDAKAAVAQKASEAAAYAQQALDNPALAWSGLQAVAARQAACALEEAQKAVEKMAQAANDAADAATNAAGKAADDAAAFAQARADDAKKAADAMQESLESAGNTAFETIAPVTQFFNDNGLDKLGECGSIPGRPEVPESLTNALEQIDKGTKEAVRAGSDMISQVEQNQIMEQAIYDAQRYADEYGSMADKAVTNLTDAIPTEFPLSGDCGGTPSPFDSSMLDPDARNRYMQQMMDEYEKKGKDEVEKMLKDIAKNAPSMPGMPSMPSVPGMPSMPGLPTPGAGKGFGL